MLDFDDKTLELSEDDIIEVDGKDTTSTETSDDPEARKAEKQKRHWDKVNKTIGVLVETYPRTFDWKFPLPLKKGIFEDLSQAILDEKLTGVSKTDVRKALRGYTSTRRYLEALSTHTHRFGLEGTMVEEITPEEAEQAKEVLDQRPQPKRKFQKKHPFQKREFKK